MLVNLIVTSDVRLSSFKRSLFSEGLNFLEGSLLQIIPNLPSPKSKFTLARLNAECEAGTAAHRGQRD